MITAWSPSRLAVWENCPAQAKYKFVLRLPEPPAPALDRGTRIHAEAEKYILGDDKRVPADLVKVADEIELLRKGYKKGRVRVEQSLALNAQWVPTDWFGKDAWLRCKIDVVEVGKAGGKKKLVQEAIVTDWKTGKNNARVSDKHGDQLNLYALAVISSGIAETVRARLIFTDTGEVVTKEAGCLTAREIPATRMHWEKRVAPMMNDEEFNPNPNFTCRWCAWRKSAGGLCKFG